MAAGPPLELTPEPTLHPVIALSVLEAVRACDAPAVESLARTRLSDGAIKLGRTSSVAAQIDRYARMVRRNLAVGPQELEALFTLVSRRPDATLVFADAGRRAGRLAARRTPPWLKLLHRGLPPALRDRLGRRLVRRAAAAVFGLAVSVEGTETAAGAACPAEAVPAGSACGLYGSGLAELLRVFTSFDGACFLTECRARGSGACRWNTNQQPEG